jgi:hypothetical protein
MGYSMGRLIPDGKGSTLHVEASGGVLDIWNANETELYARLDREAAIQLIKDLFLHAEHFYEWDMSDALDR